jgi:hypothetical protein
MTPKEKAQELFDKYFTTGYAINAFYAKQCTLISVDEIIKIEKNHMNHNWVNYWQKVKQEIETFKSE